MPNDNRKGATVIAKETYALIGLTAESAEMYGDRMVIRGSSIGSKHENLWVEIVNGVDVLSLLCELADARENSNVK